MNITWKANKRYVVKHPHQDTVTVLEIIAVTETNDYAIVDDLGPEGTVRKVIDIAHQSYTAIAQFPDARTPERDTDEEDAQANRRRTARSHRLLEQPPRIGSAEP
jgi:hypothetical protein